jgi:hypothetical protein
MNAIYECYYEKDIIKTRLYLQYKSTIQKHNNLRDFYHENVN